MEPSIVQDQFIQSDELENCLMGPRGEGKTEAGIMAMTIHADKQDPSFRPIPWAIIRDTWINLERTTLKSFLQPRPKSFAASIRNRLEIKDGGRFLTLPGMWEAMLFGIDSLKDLNDLQSMQLGGLWIEEAAPAAEEDIGGGIIEDAWALGITSLRHPVTTNRRAQITMNYPDEDHWTWQRFHEDGVGGFFRIPKGENKFIDDQYRKNMAEALKKRPDLATRLVEGKPGQVLLGEKVMPEYNEDVHRARVDLNPNPKFPTYRFWDGGLTPTCVFVQITPSGRWFFLDTLRGHNIGMKQFIRNQVKPLIAHRYSQIDTWNDYGDQSLATPEQSDSEETAAKIIEDELKTVFLGGEQGWDARRRAWKDLLFSMAEDAKPLVQISRHEKILHRALNGGWHYKKDPSGRIIKDAPEKDIHSHPCDAVSHGIALIMNTKDLGPMPTHYKTEVDVFAPNYGARPTELYGGGVGGFRDGKTMDDYNPFA
jgi:hypothetical protein